MIYVARTVDRLPGLHSPKTSTEPNSPRNQRVWVSYSSFLCRLVTCSLSPSLSSSLPQRNLSRFSPRLTFQKKNNPQLFPRNRHLGSRNQRNTTVGCWHRAVKTQRQFFWRTSSCSRRSQAWVWDTTILCLLDTTYHELQSTCLYTSLGLCDALAASKL